MTSDLPEDGHTSAVLPLRSTRVGAETSHEHDGRSRGSWKGEGNVRDICCFPGASVTCRVSHDTTYL